jgi:hypothetical protein
VSRFSRRRTAEDDRIGLVVLFGFVGVVVGRHVDRKSRSKILPKRDAFHCAPNALSLASFV